MFSQYDLWKEMVKEEEDEKHDHNQLSSTTRIFDTQAKQGS